MSNTEVSPPLPRIYFHITGFGKFQGIDDNPSGKLVRSLLNTPVTKRPLSFQQVSSSSSSSSATLPSTTESSLCIIQSTQVAEVSVQGAEQVLSVIQQDIQKLNQESLSSSSSSISSSPSSSTPSPTSYENSIYVPVYHVWLHFGVAAGAPCFFLEQVGYNDKTFRIPDEQGYQPKAEPIEPNVPWAQVRHTYLVVRDLVTKLQQKGYMAVQASRDPGRFLCNYIYYRSLELGNNLNTLWAKQEKIQFDPTDSSQPLPPHLNLFIHVPNYDVIPIDEQIKFAWDTMDEIVKAIHKNKGLVPCKPEQSGIVSSSFSSSLSNTVVDFTSENTLDTNQYILDVKSGVFNTNNHNPNGNLRGSMATVPPLPSSSSSTTVPPSIPPSIESLPIYTSLMELGFSSSLCKQAIEKFGEDTTMDIAVEWMLAHQDDPSLSASASSSSTTSSSSSLSSSLPLFNLPSILSTVTNTIQSIFTRLKMVIVVRSDLEMTKGKIAAQACHVALKCVRNMNKQNDTMRNIVRQWENNGEPIVILKGDSLDQIQALYHAAKEAKLPAYFIQDAGRTQVDPGTVTVLGIGPADESLIDTVTGRLKLL